MHIGEHSQLDDPNRLLDKITELREDLSHRLTFDRINLAESYKNGNLKVVVRMRHWRNGLSLCLRRYADRRRSAFE